MKKKKYVAPLIIGSLALIQLIGIALLIIFLDLNMWWKLLLFVIFTVDNFLIFYFVRERFKEIEGGEEDDLDKY